MRALAREILPSCENCFAPSLSLFCESCYIESRFQNACASCGHCPLADTLEICLPCEKKSKSFESLKVGFFYTEAWRRWLLSIKIFGYRERLKELRSLPALSALIPKDAGKVVALPSDPLATKRRLFDFSEAFGREIASLQSLEFRGIPFVRRPFLESQKSQTKSERLRWLKETLELKAEFASGEGQSLLLVDDVMTTGSSIEAASSLLQKAGWRVNVFALLRRPALPLMGR